MKKMSLILVMFLFTAGTGKVLAQNADREANLRSLAATEEAFARMALEKGINAAFVEYFADESIIFNPEPSNGKQFYLTGEKDPGILTWKPIFTDVSAAGDMGYNTGPYEYKTAADQPPVAFGYFVSMWRKQADGRWKVVLDLGTRNSQPTEVPPQSFARENISLKKTDAVSEQKKLAKIDEEFTRTLASNKPKNDISKYISDNVRMNRMRAFPSTSREELLTDLRAKQGKFSAKTAALFVAQSGDLGYSYGSYEVINSQNNASSPNEKGSFLRVWRREGGKWKIVLDELHAAPIQKQANQ